MSAVASSRSKTRVATLGVGWVVAVQFVAMTALAATLGTWQDEEYTLATTAHGAAYAFGRAISYELQAPLYFWLLAALRHLDSSVFFARMFSVVAACALTPVAAAIAQRIRPGLDARIFAALVAFNPFVVFAALEIRLYALAILVSAGLWLAFDLGYLDGAKPRARVALVMLAIAALYLQYFLAFELASFAVALVVARKWRSLRAYVAALAIVGLAFVPLGVVLRSQVSGAFGVRASLPGAYGSVLIHPVLDFVVPLGYETLVGRYVHQAIAGEAILLAALLVAGRPRLDVRTLAIVAIAATIECIYVFLDNVLHYELVVPRHFVALFVPEAAAIYALVAAFRARRAATCAAAVVALVALTTVASLAVTYRSLAKTGDWTRVAAYLNSQARAGDTIAVYPADGIMPLERYYRGAAPLVPFPRTLPPNTYATDALFVRSAAEASHDLARLSRHSRLWLVRYGGCTRFDFYGCRELDAAVRRDYRPVEDRDFWGNEVQRIEPLRGTGAPAP